MINCDLMLQWDGAIQPVQSEILYIWLWDEGLSMRHNHTDVVIQRGRLCRLCKHSVHARKPFDFQNVDHLMDLLNSIKTIPRSVRVSRDKPERFSNEHYLRWQDSGNWQPLFLSPTRVCRVNLYFSPIVKSHGNNRPSGNLQKQTVGCVNSGIWMS